MHELRYKGINIIDTRNDRDAVAMIMITEGTDFPSKTEYTEIAQRYPEGIRSTLRNIGVRSGTLREY